MPYYFSIQETTILIQDILRIFNHFYE